MLEEHEKKFNRSFSLIPSENVLSPLARLAFLSDSFSRYFYDEKNFFRYWRFEGGSLIGRVQQEILIPLLQKVGRARHVNVRPVSGLSAMTQVLSAFSGEEATLFSIPVANGGHPETSYLAERFGYRVIGVPFSDWAHVDLEALGRLVEQKHPSLVYLDHSTFLFPLELPPLVHTIREATKAAVHIHVDSSHINGLIWGGELPNPLESGADSYGGSTHKTFPGPHKAVLFTNNDDISDKFIEAGVRITSHHHTAEMVALAISLVEFVECGGAIYAAQVCSNAIALAKHLRERGFRISGEPWGFTKNHQVWIEPEGATAPVLASKLFEAGLVVNPIDPLPSLNRPGLRLGVNEATRLGLKASDMEMLSEFFAALLLENRPVQEVSLKVGEFRRLFRPEFCYQGEIFEAKLAGLCSVFEDDRRRLAFKQRGECIT